MVSGGADSACAAAGLARMLGRRVRCTRCTSTTALRAGADEGEAAARRLCAALRIDLHVERPQRAARGNLQAAARELRYAAAERLRGRTGADCDRHRPHPHRRRRDRRSTGSPPRPGRGRCSASRRAAGRVVRPLLELERERRARAGRRRRPAVRRRRDQRRPALRPQPDPRRGPAGARASSTPRRSATSPRPAPSSPRRPSCSTASCSRRSTDAGAGAGAVAIARRGAGAVRAGRCGGSRCGRSPSAPPAARSRWAARARPRSSGSRLEPRAARSSSAAGWSPPARPGFVRFSAATAEAAPEPVALRLPGPGADRRLGGARRASPGAGRARRPRAGDPRRRGALGHGSRSAPGARATGSGRSGWAGRRRSQDLFTDRGVPRSLRRSAPGGHGRRRGRLGRRGRRLGGLPARRPGPSRSPSSPPACWT